MSRSRGALPLPSAGEARRSFDRASASFERVAVVHGEARRRLLERLEAIRLEPRWVLDLGCATAKGAIELAQRYPRARVLAVDSSRGMLGEAARRAAGHERVVVVGGDAERLPLASGSIQLLFANLLLPWCSPQRAFSEAARVLSDGGAFVFSTVGPDTLEQVRRAWSEVDDSAHVHGFVDMHDVGDLALAAGLAEPVLDVHRLTLTYRDLGALIRDLRGSGAVNIAANRRASLTGRRRWQRFAAALEARRHDGRLAVTVELVFGQAWGSGLSRTVGGAEEVGIALEKITRTRGP